MVRLKWLKIIVQYRKKLKFITVDIFYDSIEPTFLKSKYGTLNFYGRVLVMLSYVVRMVS